MGQEARISRGKRGAGSQSAALIADCQPPLDVITATGKHKEASQLAAELHLHELMRGWDEQAGVLEVDRYLVECLAGLPGPRAVLKPPEIAKQLGVAPETVVGWIKSRQLKGSNLATDARSQYVVQPDDLARFLESRQPQPRQPFRLEPGRKSLET